MASSGQDGEDSGELGDKEQRASPDLHDMFEHACKLTEPLFDAHEGMGGAANLRVYALRTLHDAYPDLTMQELALLVSGVTGYHLARLKKVTK